MPVHIKFTASIDCILWLIFAHFVADFICQSDQMAQGKSKDNEWLTMHVMVYSIVVIIMSTLVFKEIKQIMAFGGLNFVAHWCIDYCTSRVNAKLFMGWLEDLKRRIKLEGTDFSKPDTLHWFFVGVGFDQFLHYATLLLTYQLIGSLSWMTK